MGGFKSEVQQPPGDNAPKRRGWLLDARASLHLRYGLLCHGGLICGGASCRAAYRSWVDNLNSRNLEGV